MPERRIQPRPEVVFLDLGDTLIRAHPSWSAVYRGVLAAHGVEVAPDALRDALEATFGNNGDHVEGPFEASAEASYQRLKRFDTQVLERLGRPVPPDRFFRSLEAAFAERASWWVFPDVPPALDALQDAGIRLAIISNWGWSAPELIHTLELARHFEALVISDRVGYLKPSAGIFHHALEVMRVTPDRALHIGDSVPADVVGARGVGIQPVLVQRAPGPGGASTSISGRSSLADDPPCIGDLWDLLDLLGIDRPGDRPAAVPSD
ncbi:MAG: HAD-IA family hydrolase [Chloroflexi bacterium]|nr:HAD-IA family hydrolase [Chloroflexota bacterium]